MSLRNHILICSFLGLGLGFTTLPARGEHNNSSFGNNGQFSRASFFGNGNISGGGGGGGGGAQYKPNELAKALGKVAEKYQTQINEGTKNAQSAMQESTTALLGSLDKLKVAEAGESTTKELAKGVEAIGKEDNKAMQANFEELISAITANSATNVQIIKANAVGASLNQEIEPIPSTSKGVSIGEQILNLQETRPTGSKDPLALALGAEASALDSKRDRRPADPPPLPGGVATTTTGGNHPITSIGGGVLGSKR